MINELVFMNGYGFYVWSSFTVTILGFSSLYYIISSQLKKETKKFKDKVQSLDPIKVKIVRKQSLIKKILASSLI